MYFKECYSQTALVDSSGTTVAWILLTVDGDYVVSFVDCNKEGSGVILDLKIKQKSMQRDRSLFERLLFG